MHPPFRGCLDFAAWKTENHGMDHLVVIGFRGIIFPPKQLRLMVGEQKVMDIDEVKGAERPSREHVERTRRTIPQGADRNALLEACGRRFFAMRRTLERCSGKPQHQHHQIEREKGSRHSCVPRGSIHRRRDDAIRHRPVIYRR
jgi:hypothetical protein